MAAAEGLAKQDVSSGFTWKPEYHAQIQAIAETDEVPDSLDWPSLREAIKYQIRKAIDAFPESPSPYLHPAARPQPSQQPLTSIAGSSQAIAYSNGPRGDSTSSQSSSSPSSSSSSSSSSTADKAAEGLQARSASAETSDNAKSAAHAAENGNSREDASDSESDEDGSDPGNADFRWMNQDSAGLGSASFMSDADRSTFYPAKTQPSNFGKKSWGRQLTASEREAELSMVFGLLDDFDSSPPFTIQRLAELVLEPRRFVRSAPKYLSSLTRVLGMTASHRDFPPVSPGIAPGALSVTSTFAGGADAIQRMTGPPSPMVAPIFSPIPFLKRPPPVHDDEDDGGGGDARSNSNSRDRDTDVIPDLSLGEGAPSISASTQPRSNNHGDLSSAGSDVPAPPPVSLDGNDATAMAVDASSTDVAAPTASSSMTTATVGTAHGDASREGSIGVQPLGVPRGRVDEFDDYRDQGSGEDEVVKEDGVPQAPTGGEHRMDTAMHPLTSTTTSAVSAASLNSDDRAPTAAVDHSPPPATASATDENGETETEKAEQRRQIKRMKSDVTSPSAETAQAAVASAESS
ncbi:unnamed protein product [Parajaminaea phylloscopi]